MGYAEPGTTYIPSTNTGKINIVSNHTCAICNHNFIEDVAFNSLAAKTLIVCKPCHDEHKDAIIDAFAKNIIWGLVVLGAPRNRYVRFDTTK